jgi:hypothetical protein
MYKIISDKNASVLPFVSLMKLSPDYERSEIQVSADIPNADIIGHEDNDVWLFGLRLRRSA